MRRLLAPPAETVTSRDVPSFSTVIAAYQVAVPRDGPERPVSDGG
jgi:hypothetical protein